MDGRVVSEVDRGQVEGRRRSRRRSKEDGGGGSIQQYIVQSGLRNQGRLLGDHVLASRVFSSMESTC